jgi:hypothetical protein
MISKDCWARLRRQAAPALFSVTFMLVNLAVVAAKLQPMMPASERWG